MKKTTALAMVIGLSLAAAPAAHGWFSLLDFNDQMFPPDPPWLEFFNEGGAAFVDLGGGNFALRLDSPDRSGDPIVENVGYNEYYAFDIPDPANQPVGDYNGNNTVDAADYVVWRKNEGTMNPLPKDPIGGEIGQGQYDNWRANFGQNISSAYEHVSATRFRLHTFTPTGQENILSPSTPVASPTITLVDGHYWIWSMLSLEANRPILDLGPAVADEWHEVYIMTTVEGVDPDTGIPNAGGAKVWWDGQIVFDGPVDGGGNVFQGGYIEFGSGTYWQTTAGTEVDFDWVGFGDVFDFPVVGAGGGQTAGVVPEPATMSLLLLLATIASTIRRRAR
jgi:hypothetical protein